ncbi:CobW family GTP-binding protein [Frigidibacter sp. MR17.24]|uniref:CobW family GTP-binding protein n=1 Tax=Frigidibacter sp. MR17.24 TaxID=3127345 RepID=UPI003012E4BB
MSGAGEGDGRLGLRILGGFLGAGKSTWLRHHLHDHPTPPVVVLNEMGAVPVDGRLLHRAAALHVVAGGCACCTRREALIGTLRAICNDRTRAGDASAASGTLILETSGIAQPAAIAGAILVDPVLSRHLRIEAITVVVDGAEGAARLAGDPLARRQLEAAHEVVISRLDAAAPQALADTLAMVRRLAPAAPVTAASFGAAMPLPDLPPPGPAPALGADEREIVSVVLPLGDGPGDTGDWTAFGLFLSALLHRHGQSIFRAKGVVATPRGRLLLQAVSGHVQPPELLPEGVAADDNRVVLIGHVDRPEAIAAAWAAMRAG